LRLLLARSASFWPRPAPWPAAGAQLLDRLLRPLQLVAGHLAGLAGRPPGQLLAQGLDLLLGLGDELVGLALQALLHLAVDVTGQRLAVPGHPALVALEVGQLLHHLGGHAVLGPEALAPEVVGVLVQRLLQLLELLAQLGQGLGHRGRVPLLEELVQLLDLGQRVLHVGHVLPLGGHLVAGLHLGDLAGQLLQPRAQVAHLRARAGA
jgi:hypothetical protein